MEIAALTAFLAPFLSALAERSGATAAEAAARFGDAAWEHAQKLWGRLSGRVNAEPAAQGAVEDVVAAPDSPGAQGSLAWQLEKLFAADPSLKADVEQLWERACAASVTVTHVTAAGAGSVAVGGNVHGSISTGGSHGAPPSASCSESQE